MSLSRPIALIDQSNCIGCGRCISACPFNAIKMNDENKAEVISMACRGCMRCAPACPVNIIKRS